MSNKTLALIIGDNIAEYRKLAGMSQQQLSEKVGISPAFMSRVERGAKMMKIETLLRIADALNVSCDALLRPNPHTAHMENIIHMLEAVPDAYLPGIEQIIRVCLKEFDVKQHKTPNM